METMRRPRHKKLWIAAGILLAALLLRNSFFWYVSDYYRAEDVVLAVLAQEAGLQLLEQKVGHLGLSGLSKVVDALCAGHRKAGFSVKADAAGNGERARFQRTGRLHGAAEQGGPIALPHAVRRNADGAEGPDGDYPSVVGTDFRAHIHHMADDPPGLKCNLCLRFNSSGTGICVVYWP